VLNPFFKQTHNSETATRWAYAENGKWDAERNVREFIGAMTAPEPDKSRQRSQQDAERHGACRDTEQDQVFQG